MSKYNQGEDSIIELREMRFRNLNVSYLYHLTHIENLESILKLGILPLNNLKNLSRSHSDISMPDVQLRRDMRKIITSSGMTYNVHDFVPFFYRKKTPMLYKRKEQVGELCFIVIQVRSICTEGLLCVASDGNVASPKTECWELFPNGFSRLNRLNWDIIHADSWTSYKDGKRICSAELLIRPHIKPDDIYAIIFPSSNSKKSIDQLLLSNKLLNNPLRPIQTTVCPEDFFMFANF